MRHEPVLLQETIDGLHLTSNANVIDCTLGDGGHTEAILKETAPNGRVLGIDADPESLLRAKRFLYGFGKRVVYVRDSFAHLAEIAAQEKFSPVHGIVFDLGWSSPQFEERGRGFSFQKDEPLDMRYAGREQPVTAEEIVNTYTADDLAKIFQAYGEEELSPQIAQAIVAARRAQPIATTARLVEIVLSVYRARIGTDREVPWIGGLHPATKVFQALRIAVNDELSALKQALPQAVNLLSPGGRLAVISFHSVEDRIVKHYFKDEEDRRVRWINKKPIEPGDEEAAKNSRARSAKLRIVEKI